GVAGDRGRPGADGNALASGGAAAAWLRPLRAHGQRLRPPRTVRALGRGARPQGRRPADRLGPALRGLRRHHRLARCVFLAGARRRPPGGEGRPLRPRPRPLVRQRPPYDLPDPRPARPGLGRPRPRRRRRPARPLRAGRPPRRRPRHLGRHLRRPLRRPPPCPRRLRRARRGGPAGHRSRPPARIRCPGGMAAPLRLPRRPRSGRALPPPQRPGRVRPPGRPGSGAARGCPCRRADADGGRPGAGVGDGGPKFDAGRGKGHSRRHSV
ncbi:MAG: FIG01212366: hypothetical protein, partial [uncultured Thermomicrobiales bacterium]